MANLRESFKNRNTYIPVSVQNSMAKHMERTMPSHLKKYQQGGFIPKHAERAMTAHMEKSLPSHLKKYADPYVQQNVVWSKSSKGTVANSTSQTTSAYRPINSTIPRSSTNNELLASDNKTNQSAANLNQPTNEYEFIMNPENGAKPPMFTPPSSTKMRVILFGGIILIVIILIWILFSILNSSSNKQKGNLLGAAQTQAEIIRMIESGEDVISSQDLKNQAATLHAVMVSSQQDTVAALANRGKKVKDKDLALGENPDNDQALVDGQQNGQTDQAFKDIIDKLLADYSSELKSVYDNGGPHEKQLANDTFSQINTIFPSEKETK